MNNILLFGAGMSSNALIGYLLMNAAQYDWHLTVADYNLEHAQERVGGHSRASAVQLDATDIDKRRSFISKADIVISMLPAFMHADVARDCLHFKKHLITASYVSQEMLELGKEAQKQGLIFMGELGLDPGIDHMSAMKKIDEMKAEGCEINSFKSYTGGLIAPDSDNNPWHYKFTWNPRNVIVAGQGTAQYLKNGKLKYLPYHHLFDRYEEVEICGLGMWEVYANRDSLLYRSKYGLDQIPTIFRGTIRHKGFCQAWNTFIKLGLTDDSFPIVDSDKLTYGELTEAFLPDSDADLTLRQRVAALMKVDESDPSMDLIEWTGILGDEKIGLQSATPAAILEHLLREKWKLEQRDKDMILMQHEFEYTNKGEKFRSYSTMILTGTDSIDTAMSKLVGLPLGMFVKQVLLGKFVQTEGTHIPVTSEIYLPILEELEQYGVVFNEKTVRLEEAAVMEV